MQRVVITGATGFIGRGLIPVLESIGYQVILAQRSRTSYGNSVPLDLSADRPILPAHLDQVDTVIHLAGLAHTRKGQKDEAYKINTDGTRKLAQAAIVAGVRRFVFVSSAGVHGTTDGGKPVTPDDPMRPVDNYAASKAAAEDALASLAAREKLSVAVVRPPLVYGVNAPGNFARLASWAQRGGPLPAGCWSNTRSFVARQNLCDLLLRLVFAPDSTFETFLVRDPSDVSTGAFYAELCRALDVEARSIPIPQSALRYLLDTTGQSKMADALLRNFRLDDSKTRTRLNWSPPIDMQTAMQEAVRRTL